MTREDAFALLNLSATASPEDIQSNFDNLYSEYNMRLTNAPTPNLKKLYQKNLQELEEARILLLSGHSVSNTDFPSATPVYHASTPVSKQTISSNPLPTASPINPVKKPSSAGPFWIIMTLAVATIAVYMGILWKEAHDDLFKAQMEVKNLSQFKSIKNGTFKIFNAGSYDFIISNYSVVYLNKAGEFVKHIGFSDEVIKPNATKQFEEVENNVVVWDGSVIFYSFELSIAGKPYLYTGVWANETSENGTLKINQDKLINK